MKCNFMTSNIDCKFKVFDNQSYIFRCSCMGSCPYMECNEPIKESKFYKSKSMGQMELNL